MDLAVRLCSGSLPSHWLAANWRLDSVLVGLNLQKSAVDLHRNAWFPRLKHRFFKSKDANLNDH